jgi:enoyl-CoA hydratase/carnithine racemase
VSEYIQVSVRDGVQIIRLTRSEKKNTLNIETYRALLSAFEAGEANARVHVRVIFGSEGVFVAGSDVADFLRAGTKKEKVLAPMLNFFQKLVFTEKPLIAAVDGLAIGIGTALLFHCDLVYATKESAFVTPSVELGLVPEAGSSLLATQRLGYAAAFALLVMGKPFTAEAALKSRLVNALVSRDALEKHALDAAAKLVAKPPHALALSRKLLRGDPEKVWRRIQEETRYFIECLASEETRNAFQAFLNRPLTEATH